MKDVAIHLLMATAGMTLWAWAVFAAQAHSLLLVCLLAAAASVFAARRG